MIDGDDVRAVHKEGRGYVVWSQLYGESVALFDDQGDFVRRIGRAGEGPGELKQVEAVDFLGRDEILVLDRNQRLTTFRESGEHVRDVPLTGIRPSRAFHVSEGDTTAILGWFGASPESVGYPLHRVDLRTGDVARHFGSSNPASWSVSEPQARVTLLGRTDRLVDGVWWAKKARPHIEHWSLDDDHRLTITGDLEWYPGRAGERPRGSPWGSMIDFSVDAQNRLWLLTWAPDPDWRDVDRGGAEGGMPLDRALNYWDARLDVFDLSQVRHIASHTWDSPWVKLTHEEGQVLISLVEYQTPSWPRVFIYNVEFPR